MDVVMEGRVLSIFFVSVSRSLSLEQLFFLPMWAKSPISVDILNINAYIHINEDMLQTTIVLILN